MAASDKKGKGKMTIQPANTGGSFLIKEREDGTIPFSPGKEEQITMDLVDNVLPKDVKIDFVLLDTEMSEI